MNNYLQQKLLYLGDLLFAKYQDSKIKVKDYFNLVRGKTPPTERLEYYHHGTIPWINSGVLTNLYFLTKNTTPSKLINELAVAECQLAYAQPNNLLISRIEPSSNKLTWCQKQVLFSCDV
jgi:hypothetical protein